MKIWILASVLTFFLSETSFGSQLSDRGEHLIVVGLNPCETTHRGHLIQKALAAGFGCHVETNSGREDGELAWHIKYLASYIHDSPAFATWLASHSIVLNGSPFWEKVAGIRFGGCLRALP